MGCNVKYEEGFPNTVYEEMRKYFVKIGRPLVIFDFTPDPF